MAQITGAQNERVFSIQKWLGLNQNPDGDTKLRMGEAATMRNWRVTRDGNLQKRPGTKEVLHIGTDSIDQYGNTVYQPIQQVWTGFVGGNEKVVVVCDDKLINCTEGPVELGTLSVGSDSRILMFGFDDKLYVITGGQTVQTANGVSAIFGGNMYVWDGTDGDPTATPPILPGFSVVDPYVPLVATGIPPVGGTGDGALLEQVNKLTHKRRVWLSGNNSGKDYKLPEEIDGIDKVIDLQTNQEIPATVESGGVTTTNWTWDSTDKQLEFDAITPPEAENCIEVQYHVAEADTLDARNEILGANYCEFYNGSQDTRVFLYGSSSVGNWANLYYSDLDYNGKPRADYFPDLNVVRVGTANTPVTGLIRQFSRMVCFKPDGAWSISYGTITTATGDQIPGFYTHPLNRTIGNEPLGQVQLVLNNPISILGQDVYEWKAGSYGNLTNDERQARRISDRVYETIRQIIPPYEGEGYYKYWGVRTFDDNYRQEYYIFNTEGQALVWNYAADVWYYYDNFPMLLPFVYQGELYYGSEWGGIQHVSTDYTADKFADQVPVAIDCHWESGSMSFGADYQRKYAAMIWVGIKPESRSEVWVTVQTDKSSTYLEKVVATSLFGFDHVDFNDWTFAINRRPQMKRLKIKAKKFVYYNLVLQNKDADIDRTENLDAFNFGDTDFGDMNFKVAHLDFRGTSATVTSVDMRVRMTGYAK